MTRLLVVLLFCSVVRWVGAAGEAPSLTPDQAKLFQEVQVLAETDANAARTRIASMEEDRHPIFDVFRGDLLQADQQDEEAIKAFTTALEKAPDYDQARIRLAHAYASVGKLELIPGVLEPVLSGGRGTSQTFSLLGRAWLAQERPVSAEMAFRHWLLREGNSVDARMGLSQALIEQQRWREARALADELIEEVPGRIELWRLRASIAASEEPDSARAFVLLETAKRLQVLRGSDLADVGDQAASIGLVAEAKEAYEAAFQPSSSSENPSGSRLIQAGELLWRVGDHSEAERWLKLSEAAVEKDSPEYHRLVRLRARLADARDDTNASTALWQELLALEPLNGEAMMALSEVWRDTDPDKAGQWMKRASRQEDVRRQALLRLVEWAVEDAEWDEGLGYLREARREQDHPHLRRYEEQLMLWIEQVQQP